MRRIGIAALALAVVAAMHGALCEKVLAASHAAAACCGEACPPRPDTATAMQCCSMDSPAASVAATPSSSRAAGSLDVLACGYAASSMSLPELHRTTAAHLGLPSVAPPTPERLCSLQI